MNFAIVFFVLYRYALKPLAALMNDRKKTIAQGVTDAVTNAALVEQTRALFDQEKAKAQEAAQQLLHAMKAEIEEKRLALIADTHAQAEKLIADTRMQLEQEKVTIIQEARAAIGGLVVQSTEKVMQNLPANVKEALLEQAIKDL